MARSKLTWAEIRARNEAAGETWFADAPTKRRRIECEPVRMPDGGCAWCCTEQDGSAPRGTPHSRIQRVVRFWPDGRIAAVEVGWLEDTPAARRAVKAYARGQL